MLTIAKLGVGQEDYYLGKVARGIEDYYSGEGEQPGEWIGKGSARLGLAGDLRSSHLRALLSGTNPFNSEPLVGRRTAKHLPGWDLTFCAPKSVSVLFGLADGEIRAEVVAAHETAVRAGIEYLEAHGSVGRRESAGSISWIRGEGLVVAAFRHRTSRAGDPHLHTHGLTMNVVELMDGGWRALHSPVIYRHARTAGFVYQAVLRGELTERLGLAWDEIRNGYAEVRGVPQGLLAAFSKRHAEIEAALTVAGEQSARAAEIAQLRTKKIKEPSIESETLYDRWRTEAAEHGFNPDALRQLLFHQAHAVTEDDLSQAINAMTSSEGLTAHDATFGRRDVIRAWCAALPTGTKVRLSDLEALSDDLLASPDVMPVLHGHHQLAANDVVHDANGNVTTPALLERAWSTTEMLATEQQLLDSAVAAKQTQRGQVGHQQAAALLASRHELSDEQRSMVAKVTTSGDGIEAVVGRAGSGKTYALAAAAEIWRAAGYQPIGVALAGRAASELESGAGIPSTTVAQFLIDANHADVGVVHAGNVIIVDEAGMVDTRRLAALLSHANRAQAKVLLVGDQHQLPSVEAGGAFEALLQRIGYTELAVNRRQVEPWERDTLDRFRTAMTGSADVEELLTSYHEHGRVHVGSNPSDVRAAMVADWYEARRTGQKVAMLALRRSDVRDLNARARALLVTDETVAADGLRMDDKVFAAGDRVVCLRGDRRLGVHNALFGTITDTDSATGTIAIESESDGSATVLPGWYIAGGFVSHAYATTIHKSQGATYDRVFLLGDEALCRQAGYTGMSRGRYRNDVYVVATPDPLSEYDLEQHGEPWIEEDPLCGLVRALSRDGAKVLAASQTRSDWLWNGAESLGDLWARRDEVVAHLSDDDRQARRLRALNHRIRHRTELAGRSAELDRCDYVIDVIGDPPLDDDGRALWRRAAGALESYRARWGAETLVGQEFASISSAQQRHLDHVDTCVTELLETRTATSDDLEIDAFA